MTDSIKVSRRSLLAWSAASAALASACSRAPRLKIAPYVKQPPGVHPGTPLYYATTHEVGGRGFGLVVECHEGRPTKVEGNPLHPASLGASRPIDQALIASLYDPDRAREPHDERGPLSYASFTESIARPSGKTVVLLEPTSSRTVAGLVARIRRELPNVSVFFDAPLAPRGAWEATKAGAGAAAETILDTARAPLILSLGADFLTSGPSWVRDARGLVARGARNRALLFVIESHTTATGAFADERAAGSARRRALLARAIAVRALLDSSMAAPATLQTIAGRWRGEAGKDDRALAARWGDELVRRRGATLAGELETAPFHALAMVLNAVVGANVELRRSSIVDAGSSSFDRLAFAHAMSAADLAIIIGANPVYSTIIDAPTLHKIAKTAYVGAYENETAAAMAAFVPLAHPLEMWGDASADDGTASLIQPMITPMFGGRAPAEILSALLGEGATSAQALTRSALAALSPSAWEDALSNGVVSDAKADLGRVDLASDELTKILAAWELPPESPIEVGLHPSPALYDGRYANVPALCELPDPVTKLTWGNHALVGAELAKKLGASEGDELRIAGKRGTITLPLAIDEGIEGSVIAIAYGSGRTGSESIARGVGANAFVLDPNETISASRTGGTHPLARTQHEFSLEGRGDAIARLRFSDEPTFTPAPKRLSIYEKTPTLDAKQQWAMSVDLSACTSCNACVVACQAENNVPTVGYDGVIAGRAMHWIRIDRYNARGGTVMQPMLCQHCEEAPCEYVCPVNATVHSPDGLNEMIYNRCVGTRFCSNNCPYKVRRFNWFDYHQDETALAELAHNPEVTVRERGVMEKCTFCVQRIRLTEQTAKIDGRALRRDEVVSACAQACPTQAIVFGDMADAGSAVSKALGDGEAYAALNDLGTKPRVRYQPKVVARPRGNG